MDTATTVQLPIVNEQSSKDRNAIYAHDVQLYQNAPFGEITLDELQEICQTRLKVLSLVERTHLKKLTETISQRRAALTERLYKEGIDEFARLIDNPGCKSHADINIHVRRRDHISHVMLRSAVAFNISKKRWFFKQEVRLFKLKFSTLDSDGIKQFMHINNLDLIPITQSEKEDIREHLQMSSSCIKDIDNTQFYKLPFSQVTSLVKKRKVLIIQGQAFVPEEAIVFAFVPHFKRILILSFENAREARANIYNDERLTCIFNKLENDIRIENTILVQDQDIKEYCTLDQLDVLSKTSYPLCMRVLHKGLRKSHHLTNGGRVQYGLFLKGIGISLSDSFIFWKDEFTKIMTQDTFNKKYAYYIRYLYGWEGSKRDYQPYKCSKIMESTVGPRDYHGCPFKHMIHDTLETELIDCGLNRLQRAEIVNLTKRGQYSRACNQFFEIKHNCFNETMFNHPNIYFNKSMKHRISCCDDDAY